MSAHILLIDDSRIVQQTVTLSLGQVFSVVCVSDAAALAVALASEAPDVAIIAVRFAGKGGGYEVAARLRSEAPATKIILTYGVMEEPDAGRVEALMPESVLRKPWAQEALRTLVDELLAAPARSTQPVPSLPAAADAPPVDLAPTAEPADVLDSMPPMAADDGLPPVSFDDLPPSPEELSALPREAPWVDAGSFDGEDLPSTQEFSELVEIPEVNEPMAADAAWQSEPDASGFPDVSGIDGLDALSQELAALDELPPLLDDDDEDEFGLPLPEHPMTVPPDDARAAPSLRRQLDDVAILHAEETGGSANPFDALDLPDDGWCLDQTGQLGEGLDEESSPPLAAVPVIAAEPIIAAMEVLESVEQKVLEEVQVALPVEAALPTFEDSETPEPVKEGAIMSSVPALAAPLGDDAQAILRSEIQAVVERVVWELVPAIAERVVRAELARLTDLAEGSEP